MLAALSIAVLSVGSCEEVPPDPIDAGLLGKIIDDAGIDAALERDAAIDAAVDAAVAD